MNHEIIRNLYPNAYLIYDENRVFDIDGNRLTLDQALLAAEVAKIDAEQAATAYQRQRSPEYPPVADLADGLYWASKGDDTKLTEYYAACEAVKIKYPKGGAE